MPLFNYISKFIQKLLILKLNFKTLSMQWTTIANSSVISTHCTSFSISLLHRCTVICLSLIRSCGLQLTHCRANAFCYQHSIQSSMCTYAVITTVLHPNLIFTTFPWHLHGEEYFTEKLGSKLQIIDFS